MVDERAACAYSAWYPAYQAHAFPSVILDLPDDFTDYLLEDGIVLRDASGAMPQRAEPVASIVEGDEDSEGYQEWSDEEEEARGPPPEGSGAGDATADWTARFPQLHAAIEGAIERLGGRVVPRLDWSSPSDATWISHNQSLLCTNAEQVVLLLKSSDRAAHDIELARGLAGPSRAAPANGAAPEPEARPVRLALRQWRDLRPERELRCFVHQHDLHGISQRDPGQHFPQLEGEAGALRAAVCAFHRRRVADSFPVEDYALDLYVGTNGAVRILDFNPIADTTSPLLFSWDDLPYAWPRPGGAGAPAQDPEPSAGGSQAAGAGAAPQREAVGAGSAAAGADGQPPAAAGPEQAEEGEAVGSSDEGDDDLVPLRLVGHAGLVQPGARQACGMPWDMLSLQNPEGMSEVIAMLQQQRLAEQ